MEKLECRYCGATAGKNGKPFGHIGSVNLHEDKCPSNPKNVSRETSKENKGQYVDIDCAECGTEKMLLSDALKMYGTGQAKELIEQAINEGYKDICPECCEVYK